MRSRSQTLFVLGLTALAPNARAALVEFTLGGTITSTSTTGGPAWSPPTTFSTVQVGQSWSLRYIFESTQSPSISDPGYFAGAIRQFQLTIGSASLTLPATPSAPVGAISLRSQPGHQYDVAIPMSAPGGLQPSVGIYLFDPSQTALVDFAHLPATLSLPNFATRFFFLGPVNASNQYRGTITSFTPAPGTAVLPIIAFLPTIRRRR